MHIMKGITQRLHTNRIRERKRNEAVRANSSVKTNYHSLNLEVVLLVGTTNRTLWRSAFSAQVVGTPKIILSISAQILYHRVTKGFNRSVYTAAQRNVTLVQMNATSRWKHRSPNKSLDLTFKRFPCSQVGVSGGVRVIRTREAHSVT